jgi:1-acyl-sn-glycerol-3-phosphate acyltransferase
VAVFFESISPELITFLSVPVATVRSIVTYIIVSLYVLIVGPIGMGITILFKAKGLLYELGHVGVGLALGCAGIRYHVVGREHLPVGRAVVFCSNHQSNVDPPVLFQALHRRLHVLYKAEMGSLPVLGKVLEIGEFIAVPRANREEAFRAIERAAASIRAGNTFLIFPEGTRSRCDELLPFK